VSVLIYRVDAPPTERQERRREQSILRSCSLSSRTLLTPTSAETTAERMRRSPSNVDFYKPTGTVQARESV